MVYLQGMIFFKQVITLVRKDFQLEWRSKYAIGSILLYVTSTIFVCYQAFKSPDPITWNALFWIILLFASLNALSRSFVQESQGRQLYYYTLTSPQVIIVAKLIYNTLLMLGLALIAYIIYTVIFNQKVGDPALYLIAVLLGGFSFASVFTMISGISSKTGNSGTLMAILGFPVIIPLLVLLVKLSKNALDGLDRSVSMDEAGVLIAINVVVLTISLMLFPYLWRD